MMFIKHATARLFFACVLSLAAACSSTEADGSGSCADDEGLDCDDDASESADESGSDDEEEGASDSEEEEEDDGTDSNEADAGVDAGRQGAGPDAMNDAGAADARTRSSDASPSSDGSSADAENDVAEDSGTRGVAQALPPIDDYSQKGPFATTMTANTGPSSAYTIFRPEPLGEDGFLHSPIIFGPGIITSPAQYTELLTHLASHGFVTICVNRLSGGPNAPENLEAMETGLDWIVAQNSESGVFEGKLAVDRAVTMGYSIGSTASVQLSSHEAIATTVAIHGHNTMGDPHGPVLLLTGTDDVIGDVRRTLTTLNEAPAMLAALPIGHLAVLSELSGSGRYIAPITAWLRYWVNGDEQAKGFFWGADCEMCSSPWIPPETNAAWDAQEL